VGEADAVGLGLGEGEGEGKGEAAHPSGAARTRVPSNEER
jgi:hypothetical protein